MNIAFSCSVIRVDLKTDYASLKLTSFFSPALPRAPDKGNKKPLAGVTPGVSLYSSLRGRACSVRSAPGYAGAASV